ncbi:hypothetical protein COOONC_21719 [Cooperia oncophora]
MSAHCHTPCSIEFHLSNARSVLDHTSSIFETEAVPVIILMQCGQQIFGNFYVIILFVQVIVRRGEFFEAEEKYDKNDEDVIHFDLISDIRRGVDDKGEFYSLTIHRYFCGKIPDTPPEWYLKKNWPYWPE